MAIKLQVNQRGSWRNVVAVEDDRDMVIALGEAVLPLARVMGTSATWRIIDQDGFVIGYLESPGFNWRKP